MSLITAAADVAECEARIEEAKRDNYLVRGRELAAIRDEQCWRVRYSYQAFERYCEERWELTKQHAHHLIRAAEFAGSLSRALYPPAA